MIGNIGEHLETRFEQTSFTLFCHKAERQLHHPSVDKTTSHHTTVRSARGGSVPGR